MGKALPWLRVLGEVALFMATLMLLRFARPDPAGIQEVALRHGLDVIRLERKLHIYYEREMQRIFIRKPALEQAANAIYTVGYYPLIGAAGLWLYWRDRERYRLFRNTFLGTLLVSYAVFLLYPVAPPRHYPELGFHDTLAGEGEVIHYARNPFAAVPSLHFAAALLASSAITLSVRARWVRLLAGSLPPLMLVAIVATGNHFFLDAVAAMPILGFAVLAAKRLQSRDRLRQKGVQ